MKFETELVLIDTCNQCIVFSVIGKLQFAIENRHDKITKYNLTFNRHILDDLI